MNNIKVTFVMMAYNAEKYIEKAVKSVLQQTVKEVVLCVRDNGSTDRTGNILNRLSRLDNRLHVVHNKKNGVTEEGVTCFFKGWWPLKEEWTGEYISIIDADDYLEPNFVEVLYAAAKEHDADITVGGNWFFSEAGRYGQRLPVPIVTDSLRDLEPVFPSIYNCFRAWWGKLFKADFFLKEYDATWRFHYPMHWMMDTLVMINYLGRCSKLVAVDQPLYNMFVRQTSTYKTRPMDYGVLWGAYALYQNNLNFLIEHNIATEENLAFVEALHWAYLMEGMQAGLNNLSSSKEKLLQLKTAVNDSIVGRYISRRFGQIWATLEPYLTKMEEQAGEDVSIYESYLMRLKCFTDSVKVDESNPLNYPLLLGVLFDPENRNRFGMQFMDKPIQGGSEGITKYLEKKEEAWMYWCDNPTCFLELFCNRRDNTSDIEQTEKEMAEHWKAGRYEECSALVEQISKIANLNRNAMFYRILLLEKFQEHTIAILLAYTARIIFRDDKELVELCSSLIDGVQANE